MYKALALSARRLLMPRPLAVLPIVAEAPVAASAAIYDVRRNDYHRRNIILPPVASNIQLSLLTGKNTLQAQKHIRLASTASSKDSQMPNPSVVVCNMMNMLKCVDLNDLKDAPPPAFWTGLLLGGSQIVIPLLELIGGYSPVLTMFQLYSAAVTVAFCGGQKWGLALSNNPEPKPDWDTMLSAIIPVNISLLGLLTPYPVGFLLVGTSLLTALYMDLKACIYPPWACALLVFIYLTATVGLLLALSAYVLFHNSENNNKKKKNKKEDDAEEGNPGDAGTETSRNTR